MSAYTEKHIVLANEYKKMFLESRAKGDSNMAFLNAGMYNAHMWVATGEEKYRLNCSPVQLVNARQRIPVDKF